MTAMVPPTRPEGLCGQPGGDFGLLLGILGLFWATGSFAFEDIGLRLKPGPGRCAASLTRRRLILCLLVFMGPNGQIGPVSGFMVWLPRRPWGPQPDLA